ncbi:MAG: DUF504 domain-containing protein [Archaeoglobaceae archaeon]|nr:DUF504 domain-containing protein [Archaeoglobaceae archaeon]
MRKFRYSIREILNKLKWHPSFDFDKVSVLYIDRPIGVNEIKAFEIEKIGHKFIYLKSGIAIPMHRIVEIRYDGKSYWRRKDGFVEEQVEEKDG